MGDRGKDFLWIIKECCVFHQFEKVFKMKKISKYKISKCLKCKQVCAWARWFKMKNNNNNNNNIQWSLLIQIQMLHGREESIKGRVKKNWQSEALQSWCALRRLVERSILILRSRSSTRYSWSSMMTQIMHHSAYSVNVFVHHLKSLHQLLQRRLWIGWSVIRRKMCYWDQNFVDQLNGKVMLL